MTVESANAHLMTTALQTALILALPLIATIAIIGVVMGIAQTIVQIQDQNVSFLPKLIGVALLVTIAGAPALALLVLLFRSAAATAAHATGH